MDEFESQANSGRLSRIWIWRKRNGSRPTIRATQFSHLSQAFKAEAGKKNIPHRDKQLKKIEVLKQQYDEQGNPVISMDVKKKELIGNFFGSGKLYTTETWRVNDHDFEFLSEGKVIPHGIYDLARNIGYITLGTSRDTSELACVCIRNWWLNYGTCDYPDATSILLLCDCGGSNNAGYYIFKEDLPKLSNTDFHVTNWLTFCFLFVLPWSKKTNDINN